MKDECDYRVLAIIGGKHQELRRTTLKRAIKQVNSFRKDFVTALAYDIHTHEIVYPK